MSVGEGEKGRWEKQRRRDGGESWKRKEENRRKGDESRIRMVSVKGTRAVEEEQRGRWARKQQLTERRFLLPRPDFGPRYLVTAFDRPYPPQLNIICSAALEATTSVEYRL